MHHLAHHKAITRAALAERHQELHSKIGTTNGRGGMFPHPTSRARLKKFHDDTPLTPLTSWTRSQGETEQRDPATGHAVTTRPGKALTYLLLVQHLEYLPNLPHDDSLLSQHVLLDGQPVPNLQQYQRSITGVLTYKDGLRGEGRGWVLEHYTSLEKHCTFAAVTKTCPNDLKRRENTF